MCLETHSGHKFEITFITFFEDGRRDGEKKQEYRLTLYVGQYIEVLMAKANVPPNVTTKCSIQTRYGHYYVFTVVPTTVKIYEFFQTVCFKGN